jgi:hypothetical protein
MMRRVQLAVSFVALAGIAPALPVSAAAQELPAVAAARRAADAASRRATGEQEAPAPPAPAAGAQKSPSGEAPAPGQPTEKPAAESYSYRSEGRRDPFQSLQSRGGGPAPSATRPANLSGALIGELSLKGIVINQGVLVGIVQAPDRKTYFVRSNDRLFDGVVKEVLPDAVLFAQDVNDPLSTVKQRDVRKPLRSMEEPK